MLGKTATTPMSVSQRQQQEGLYCPPGYQSEYTLFHTTRIIKYVFLDGSQNVVPSHAAPDFEPSVGYLEAPKGYYYPLVIPDHSLASSYWAPEPGRLPIFVTLSKSQEKLRSAWGQPHLSRSRLPIFRQLCGEMAMSDAHGSEDTAGPRALDAEPGRVEGLDKQMEREVEKKEEEEEQEQEQEQEESSHVPLITLKEREVQP